jgi:membrane protein
LKEQISDDRLSVVAAGVAFYGLLAAFPTFTALVSVYGLVFDARQLSGHLDQLRQLLPPDAADLLIGQLLELNRAPRSALGLGVAGSVLLALWSSSAGMRALMKALNLAYGVRERRSVVAVVAVSVALALGAVLLIFMAIIAIVVLPLLSRLLGLGEGLRMALDWLRWPIIAAAFWVGLALLYRFAPCRDTAEWSWANRGAFAALGLWLGGSAIFSWYAANFGTYNATYGSMGAVVMLLLWFVISAWAVLIGAEINALRTHAARREPARRDAAAQSGASAA